MEDNVKYRVSFEIEGRVLADGIKLNEENLETGLLNEFSVIGSSYWGNRDIDTVISDLKIKRVVQ